jgi:hypothetical protein
LLLASLINGDAFDFPVVPGASIAVARDGSGLAVEVYPDAIIAVTTGAGMGGGLGVLIAIGGLVWIVVSIVGMLNVKNGPRTIWLQIGIVRHDVYTTADQQKLTQVLAALNQVVGSKGIASPS